MTSSYEEITSKDISDIVKNKSDDDSRYFSFITVIEFIDTIISLSKYLDFQNTELFSREVKEKQRLLCLKFGLTLPIQPDI